MSIRSTAKALILHEGKILLNRCMTQGGELYFDLPGGGQHMYETMEECVCREVTEETGYTVEALRFAALAEEIQDDFALREQYPDYSHRIIHLYIASLTGETGAKSEMDFQQLGSIWVTIEEADTLNLRPENLKGKIGALTSREAPCYLGTVRMNRP